jgi:hypothetical protein
LHACHTQVFDFESATHALNNIGWLLASQNWLHHSFILLQFTFAFNFASFQAIAFFEIGQYFASILFGSTAG